MSEEGELQTIGAALYPEMIEKLIKGPPCRRSGGSSLSSYYK